MSGLFQLADELLLEFGKHITDSSLLHSLCLVSKHFNALFTPMLYRRISLLDEDWRLFENISILPYETHLACAREVVIVGWYLEQDLKAGPFRAFSRKISILRSLRLLQTLDPFAKDEFLELSNDNENDNQRNDNPTTVQDDRSGKRFSEMLRRVKNLEDPTVVVPQPNCYWDELDWRSPHFQNLRKFNMRILTWETLDTNANDIAEGLFALSNLRFLSLPVSGQHGSCDFLLRRLIKFYIKERVKREKRWFCLTTLELGVGYLPDRPHPMFPLNENYLAQLHDPFTTNPWMFPVDEDYLAQLTDPLTLENLQLDLDNRVRQLSSATNI